MSVRPDPNAERANPARVGEAAGEAAAQGGANQGEAREQARAAADQAGNFRLPDDQLDAIADRTIDRLERRGAFEQQQTAEPATEPPAAEQGEHEREAAQRSGEGPPPRRRTFAERFVGRDQ